MMVENILYSEYESKNLCVSSEFARQGTCSQTSHSFLGGWGRLRPVADLTTLHASRRLRCVRRPAGGGTYFLDREAASPPGNC